MNTQDNDELLLDLESEAEPIDTRGKSKKRIIPPWTRFLAVFFVIVICGTGVVKCVQNSRKGNLADMGAVAVENKSDMSKVGVESSPHYSAKVGDYATAKAENAANSGGSFVAPVTPSVSPRPLMTPVAPEKPTIPQMPSAMPAAPRTPVQQAKKGREQKGDQSIIAFLGQLNQRLDQVSKPQSTIHNVPQPVILKAAASVGSQDATIPPKLKAGDILYAINKVSLDSDAPGPVMMKIIDDGLKGRPYNGAKVIGSFKRLNEHLYLEFTTLIMPSGATYTIKGCAIDPKTDRTAVRTNVDNHTLERWGKLMAASFLSGLGESVSRSGTSSYSSMYGGGYSAPHYDLNEQMLIASGKAADRASNIFQKEFDIPSTVTLESGIEMGILILSVGKVENSVNEAIQTQQNATQQREGQPAYNQYNQIPLRQQRAYPGYQN